MTIEGEDEIEVGDPVEEVVADGSVVTRRSVGTPGASATGTSGASMVLAHTVWTVHESFAPPDTTVV
jgi:hypothetical protein